MKSWLLLTSFAFLILAAGCDSSTTSTTQTESQQPAANPEVASLDSDTVAKQLAGKTVSNPDELTAAETDAGLQASPAIWGSVESLTRQGDNAVVASGWAADREGDGRPLSVVLFVGGKGAGMTTTQGERPDVVTQLGLAPEHKDLAFQATVDCQAGDTLLVVFVGPSGRYSNFVPKGCP